MALDPTTGKQIKDVAKERLAALKNPMASSSVSRIATSKAPPRSIDREAASMADVKQIRARQKYESMPEGDVRRGRF